MPIKHIINLSEESWDCFLGSSNISKKKKENIPFASQCKYWEIQTNYQQKRKYHKKDGRYQGASEFS